MISKHSKTVLVNSYGSNDPMPTVNYNVHPFQGLEEPKELVVRTLFVAHFRYVITMQYIVMHMKARYELKNTNERTRISCEKIQSFVLF